MSARRRLANAFADLLSLALRAGGMGFYRFVLGALWERQPLPPGAAEGGLEVSLRRPAYVEPDPEERPLVERIWAAYRRAKAEEDRVDPVFRPASMWEEILRASFAPLRQALDTGDIERFHFFLANFRSWEEATGIEESRLIHECARDPRRRRHLERRVMEPLLRWWLRGEGRGRDLSALETPAFGNPCGVVVDGRLITPGAIFAEIHGRVLAGFLPGERPIVAELGAGFGRLFTFVVRGLDRFCYLDFDLPETLCCASYYLLKSFPGRRFLLFGESDLGPDSLASHDFVLLPSWQIGGLPDDSVDLFINENSLGDMTPAACRHFVTEICRTTEAFWHCNHEVFRVHFEDGSRSLVNAEYPIPTDRFDLLVRYRDVGRLIRAGRVDYRADMYWYLYRRSR